MSVENLGERLFSSLQENTRLFESVSEELRFQTKTILQAQLDKMDLVTREEFEATLLSLERAIQRVEELEKRMSEDG